MPALPVAGWAAAVPVANSWVAAVSGAILSGGLTGLVYALAGGLGLAGIGAIGVALSLSFRPPAGCGKSFLPITDTSN